LNKDFPVEREKLRLQSKDPGPLGLKAIIFRISKGVIYD